MRGKPAKSGNLDIWTDVKNEIVKYITSIELGNKVTLYNFDEDLSKSKIVTINSENERKEAIDYVENLTANGLTTCLYTALYKTITNLKKDESERKLIYIFTDFVEACPDENYTIENIKTTFDAINSKDYAHLYYISLGKSIPNEIKDFADGNVDVTATSKTPGKDELFPEIKINSSDITVDFSINRTIGIEIPLTFTKQLKHSKMGVELVCKNDKIKLLTQDLEVTGEKVVLKFQIDNSYFSNSNEQGEILFKTKTQAKFQNNEISVKFLLPKKRKSTITIE
jgi:hypothetical protein